MSRFLTDERLQLLHAVLEMTVAQGLVLYPGCLLTADEEAQLRRIVHCLQRIGEHGLGAKMERFLPEHEHLWTDADLRRWAAGVRLGLHPKSDEELA